MNRTWTVAGYRVQERAGTWYIYIGQSGLVFQGNAEACLEYLRSRGVDLGGQR